MPTPPLPSSSAAERPVDALIGQVLRVTGGVGMLAVVALVVGLFDTFQPAWRVPMALLPPGAGAMVLAGLAMAERARRRRGIVVVLATGFVSITLIALATGAALQSPLLGFYAPVIIAAGVLAGSEAALGFAGSALLALGAMYAAELSPQLGLPGGHEAPGPHLAFLLRVGLVVTSGAFAATLARLLVRSLYRSRRQEHRFRLLLGIAADWYWEQDEQLRFTHIGPTVHGRVGLDPHPYIGRHFWEVPELERTPEEWASHRAGLEAHRPFRGFVMRLPDCDGQPKHVSMSGEPVFDDAGRFKGYWGIGRNTSEEIASRRQLEASELLYREVFERSASALLLHRDLRVLHANPAAASLFGFEDPAQLVGTSVIDLCAPEQRERSSQRMDALAAMPVGAALPIIELSMQTRDGRPLYVQGAVVRVPMPDGPANLSVVVDMTERRAAERALSEAKRQAEAANQAKSRFLANMSHEIRTPLSGVLGLARLALGHRAEPARLRQYLTQLVDSADHLSQLLSDVLDLSKVEAGEVHAERVDFDFHRLLANLGESFGEMASLKRLGWRLEIEEGVPRQAHGDPTRLRQILSNYLSNAIKFTSQGEVALQVRAVGEASVRCSVVDTGPGIDSATVERLFRPFAQADDSTTRRYGGTGLGLAICRELATLLGGRVGVDSRPGAGSVFWVELPLPPAAVPEPMAAAPAPVVADASLRGVRLLVVDDNPVNMLIAEAMLAEWGAEVTRASDGREALEVFDRAGRGFHAVLMDVHMPGMNGLDATAELRRRHSMQDLPVIGMTAAVLPEDLRATADAGMNDCVSKPFRPEQLRSVVARWTVLRAQA